MDAAAFLDFHSRGLALATSVMGQEVVVTTNPAADPPTQVTFRGVLSDVELDPEELKQFGFNFKRVFTLRVTDGSGLAQLKRGMTATEPRGDTCKLVHFRKGRFGIMLWFGSVNR